VTFLALFVIALAGYRVALAVSMDQVAAPFRTWTVRRWPARPPAPGTRGERPRLIQTLVHCPRCLSVWTCAGCTVFAWATGLIGPWPWMLLVWPAAAGLDVLAIRWVT